MDRNSCFTQGQNDHDPNYKTYQHLIDWAGDSSGKEEYDRKMEEDPNA